jgi:hypothetical protein
MAAAPASAPDGALSRAAGAASSSAGDVDALLAAAVSADGAKQLSSSPAAAPALQMSAAVDATPPVTAGDASLASLAGDGSAVHGAFSSGAAAPGDTALSSAALPNAAAVASSLSARVESGVDMLEAAPAPALGVVAGDARSVAAETTPAAARTAPQLDLAGADVQSGAAGVVRVPAMVASMRHAGNAGASVDAAATSGSIVAPSSSPAVIMDGVDALALAPAAVTSSPPPAGAATPTGEAAAAAAVLPDNSSSGDAEPGEAAVRSSAAPSSAFNYGGANPLPSLSAAVSITDDYSVPLAAAASLAAAVTAGTAALLSSSSDGGSERGGATVAGDAASPAAASASYSIHFGDSSFGVPASPPAVGGAGADDADASPAMAAATGSGADALSSSPAALSITDVPAAQHDSAPSSLPSACVADSAALPGAHAGNECPTHLPINGHAADVQLVAALALFSGEMSRALDAQEGGRASRPASSPDTPRPDVTAPDGDELSRAAPAHVAANDGADVHITVALSAARADAAAGASLPAVGALLVVPAQNSGDGDEHAPAAGPASGDAAQLEAALALFCDVPLTDARDAASAHEGEAVCEGVARLTEPAGHSPKPANGDSAQQPLDSVVACLATEAQPPAAHVVVDIDAPSTPLLGALSTTSAETSVADDGAAVTERCCRCDVLPFVLAAIALSLWLTFLMLAPHLRSHGDDVV